MVIDLTIPGGMGGMGGKETMALLREIDHRAKGIVSSGYSNDPIMANFKDYGFTGVMAKPYRLENLKEIMFSCLIEKS